MVENGGRFFRCCAYIDLNMVRAGVCRTSQWPHSGYNEIQRPRKKNILIDFRKFMELLGTDNYDQAKRYNQGQTDPKVDPVAVAGSVKSCSRAGKTACPVR